MLNRLARDGYLMLSIAFLALRLFQVPPWDQSVDAYAYWSTAHGPMYDGQTAGAMGAYLYSPAFAQLLRPLTILPWPVFVTIWTGFNLAIVWWLLGRWSLPAMLFIPIPFEIVSGNVHLMYAAAIVLGFRASFTWALPILTKVTPGIGLAWFAVRREWRQLGLALAVTAVIVGVSYALDPALWRQWIDVDRRELEHAHDRRLVPARRPADPPADRDRRGRRRRAHRPRVAAAGRRDPRAPRAVAQLARDPRGVRDAVEGAGGPGRRGPRLRARGARGGAHVSAFVATFRRFWAKVGRGARATPRSCPGSRSPAACSCSPSCRTPCAAIR